MDIFKYSLAPLLALLFWVTPASAHNDCPICLCTAVETTPEWRALHDEWWSVLKGAPDGRDASVPGIRVKQAAYFSCVDQINLMSYLLKLPGVGEGNSVIHSYNPGNHPLEDNVNNEEFAAVSVAAAYLTDYQFGIELGACLSYRNQLLEQLKKKLRIR